MCSNNKTKRFSLLALLLLAPVPSIGVLAAMVITPNFSGRAVFVISKMWILLLPLFWHLFIDRQKFRLSIPSTNGLVIGSLLGIVIALVIVAAYFTVGKYLIEPAMLKDMAADFGLSAPLTYLFGAGYWILINAALEEYVWRWFFVRKCKSLLPINIAILVSALCFTIHHTIAMQIYFDWLLVSIASLGIFIAAVIWSWCYTKYHSIWPGYLSHAIVDVSIFAIGYIIVFG